MDKVAIITTTYNSADVLPAFLQCIWEQTYHNLTLYVIDNNSEDSTLSILKAINDRRIVIIANDANLGVAKANNQGINKALEDNFHYILMMNNDVEFESTLLEKLIRFQQQNNYSLVAPKMMYFDNPDKIWYAGSWFVRKNGYLPLHRGINELDSGQYDKIVEIEYAPTCCLLVRKEVFYDVGLMDEKYFVYFDDTDFLYRVWKDGRHKMMYYPDVKFYHKVGSLTKSFRKERVKLYRGHFFLEKNIRNQIYFLKKIGGFFAYGFIMWLFLKNNIRFVINPQIRKDFTTWWLINKSYFKGLRM